MKRAPKTPKHNAEALLRSANLSNVEARFLVSDYYFCQEMRKRADMQLRHLGDKASVANAPVLQWTGQQAAEWEKAVQNALGRFGEASPVGRWMMAQHGIGSVIAAGLLAHIDIEKAPTVGHIWSFAGLNPSKKWNKGEKRPYNAALKQITYHLGECIKRTWKDADSFYGPIYGSRKKLIVERNEAGYNAERAKTFRTTSNEVRAALKKGMLPAGNLDRQACNFVAKIFLSHLHAIMYWDKYKRSAPKPFAISILGHAHEIRIPRLDLFPGFEEAYYGTGYQQAAE